MGDTIRAADGGYLLNAEQFNYTKNELGQPVLNVVGGGGGDSGVTTLHIYVSAIDRETHNHTFKADKTQTEMQFITTPTWCVMTFAAGLFGENEISIGVPPAWGAGVPSFGYIYDTKENMNIYVVLGDVIENKWQIDLISFNA